MREGGREGRRDEQCEVGAVAEAVAGTTER